MRAGDLRRAGTELRRAVDGDPRNVAAVTTLAHLLERARDPGGRRALLDHTVGLLRHDVERGELNLDTLRALVALLTLARQAARGGGRRRPGGGPGGGRARPARRTGRPRPGRSLVALRQPELDERSFPPGLPPGIRQIMRLVGPHLRPSGGELAQHLARHGVSRAERAGRGEAPRPVFDGVGAELARGRFRALRATGAARQRRPVAAAGRARLARRRHRRRASGRDGAGRDSLRGGADACAFAPRTWIAILAVPPEEAAALLVGIIRQFVPDYLHPGVRDALVEPEAARAARLIPRKIKPAVSAFAIESAGPFDVAALHAAVRDGANAAGLLASADLPAALAVVLAASGMRDPTLSLSPIAAHAEALALLRFAVSDAYDELAAAMEWAERPVVIDSGFVCLSATPVHRPTIR